MDLFTAIYTAFNFFLEFMATNPIYIFGIPLAGLYIVIQTRGVQFRFFKKGFKKLLNNKGSQDEGISSFKAAALAIGGRVGTGNIAGVTFAILAGGPGAIFWMWIVAFLSMATSFAESTLGQIYKEKDEDHVFVGGPSYYIEKGLFKKDSKYKKYGKYIAIFYSIILIISFGVFFISLQTSTILSSTYTAFDIELNSTLGISIFILLMFLTGYASFGGIRKLTNLSALIVPVMTVGYAILVLIIIITNLSFVPDFFLAIFKGAFTPPAIIGAGIYTVISNGVKRGVFSNEAGQGSGAIASASAQVDHPVEQGIAQMCTVFIDTIVICTLTGFVIITAWTQQNFFDGAISPDEYKFLLDNGNTAQMATDSFDYLIAYGGKILAVFLFFFAFSSILAEIAYGTQSVKYLFKNKKKAKHIALKVYGVITILMVAITPLLDYIQANYSQFNLFDTADYLASFLFYTNVIAMLFFIKKVKSTLKDYETKLKVTPEPKFTDKDIDFEIEDSYWKD